MKDLKILKTQHRKILNLNVNLIRIYNCINPIKSKIKITIKILILFSLINNSSPAQDKSREYLDSLYNALVSLRTTDNIKHDAPLTEEEPIKCAFSVYADVRTNFVYFAEVQKAVISTILSRPGMHTSIISPSGLFRIHFDTTGSNTPVYETSLSPRENAELVAEAADYSFEVEVGSLGYLEPPRDDAGGDNRYDIYIQNQGRGLYGYTQPENSLDNGKWTSYIVIDEEYGSGYSTHGQDAMKATVAHEFHHVIQVGSYIYRSEDQFFMELTSTSMEEFVYDDVNDYYAYMKNYFNNPLRVFSRFTQSNDAYDLAVWNIFLADTLGIDIIRRQWELMPQMRALDAISTSLSEYSTSFFEMLNQFGIWCYFTNYRAIPGEYFEEAEDYALVRLSAVDFNSPSTTANLNSPPAANNYVTFVNNEGNTPDTLTAIVTNSNYHAAIETPETVFPYQYTLFNYSEPGATSLARGYYYKSETTTPGSWSTAEILDNQLIKGGHFIEGIVDYVFPSPFYYSRNSTIYIPAKLDPFAATDLNIYSSSMDLVYSSSKIVEKKFGQSLILWDAKDNTGNKLPSGIYIFAVKTGDETKTGKIVIFND